MTGVQTCALPISMQRWAGRVDLGVAELAEKLGNEVVKSWPDGRVLRIRDVRDAVSLRFSAACCRQLDPAVMTTILEGRWMQGFSYEQSFGEVRCPALLMRGDPARGGMLSEDDATALAALLHDPVRLDFPTAGHLLHWQVRSELAILWNREMLSGVYQARWVPAKLRDGRTVKAVTFVVDTNHCQYCGDLPIERAAHHIAFAEGRRGACRDYLANTAAHARALNIHDPYIEELVERVANLRGERSVGSVLPINGIQAG